MTDREIMLESEIAELRSRLMRAERLERYIPAAVIDECVAVLDHGEIKHPGCEWKNQSAGHHTLCALGHIFGAQPPTFRESESGRLHLAHAAVRLMLACGVVLK